MQLRWQLWPLVRRQQLLLGWFLSGSERSTLVTALWFTYFRFWVSLTWNVAINMALKTMTAIPRPHFIDTCQPDWGRVNCSQFGGYVASFHHSSILSFLYFRNVAYDPQLCQCSTTDPDSVSDAMKSFPSGHAQMSAFTAAFCIVSHYHLFLSCTYFDLSL